MNNCLSKELQPLVNLQENSSNFFNKFQDKFSKNMQCKSGCSKCCYVDISIFEVEAKSIIEWVKFLTPSDKKELLATLESPVSPEKQNTLGKKISHVPFYVMIFAQYMKFGQQFVALKDFHCNIKSLM